VKNHGGQEKVEIHEKNRMRVEEVEQWGGWAAKHSRAKRPMQASRSRPSKGFFDQPSRERRYKPNQT